MDLGSSLEATPTWAVAIVVTGLILASLGIEHVLHLLAHVCLYTTLTNSIYWYLHH